MSTYSTFDTSTDLYDTDIETSCCGTADGGFEASDIYVEPYSAPYVEPYVDSSELVSVWTEPEAPVEAPYEPSSVIPAGQPGGPQVVTVDPSEGLYPSMATIGGGGDDFVIDTGADLYPTTAYVGGNDFGDVTIVSPDGGSYMAPTSMTIGPPAADSMGTNLANLYGMAAAEGDIMSQVLINKTLDSMNFSTLIWTL